MPEPKPIPFAENLAEVLPPQPVYNVASFPLEQRQAIAEDLRRWRVAHEWFARRKAAKTQQERISADSQLRLFIPTIEPAAYRDDMRRRLNILKSKLK